MDFGFSEAQNNPDEALLDGEVANPPGKDFQNLEGFRLYIGQTYFIIESNTPELKLNTRLVIERSTKSNRRIYEMSSSEKLPEIPNKTRYISAFMGIINILDKQFLMVVDYANKVCSLDEDEIYLIGAVSFIRFDTDKPDPNDQQTHDLLNYMSNLEKLMVQGYYFSFTGDLTLNKKKLQMNNNSSNLQFLWNYHIAKGVLNQQVSPKWIQKVIQGYIGYFTTNLDNRRLDYYLVSRRSCYKAGTRYNARGIDDDGYVANYVESEQILYFNNKCYSHLQIRGSVPIFWQQRGITAQTNITRPLEITQSSFIKHFNDVNTNYGRVLCINLMAKSKPGEQCLTDAYENMLQKLSLNKVKYHFFDFHEACKGQKFHRINPLIDKLKTLVDSFKFLVLDTQNNQILQQQVGIVRTNCLDCLDRTNVCQGKVAALAFADIMKYAGVNINKVLGRTIVEEMDDNNINNQHQFTLNFKTLWADNGDYISIHYSGTGSVISSVTRTGKPGLFGLLDHGMKTLNRFYIGNFEDQIKQECIDILLGQHTETVNVLNEEVQRGLSQRAREYCQFEKLSIMIVSWNVQSFTPGPNYNFSDLLSSQEFPEPDILVIGLQEIVDMSAKNVLVSSNAEQYQQWKQVLVQNLQKKQTKYHLIRESEQIGLSLFFFGNEKISQRITKVEVDKVKTGYSGTLGNKGAIALKFYVDDTSLCFVNCHLEAAEENLALRLESIQEIHQKAFQQEGVGKKKEDKIETYEYKFLFGDLNFRLAGDHFDSVLNQIISYQETHNPHVLKSLLNLDQLNNTKKLSEYLSKYSEPNITFPPTYKFFVDSDTYDDTKKNRLPSWCDRILYWNDSNSTLLHKFYTSKQQTESDHKPVASYFVIETKIADQAKKEEIIKQIKEEAPIKMAMEYADLVQPENAELEEVLEEFKKL